MVLTRAAGVSRLITMVLTYLLSWIKTKEKKSQNLKGIPRNLTSGGRKGPFVAASGQNRREIHAPLWLHW